MTSSLLNAALNLTLKLDIGVHHAHGRLLGQLVDQLLGDTASIIQITTAKISYSVEVFLLVACTPVTNNSTFLFLAILFLVYSQVQYSRNGRKCGVCDNP